MRDALAHFIVAIKFYFFFSYIFYETLYIGLGGSLIAMRDPPVGFIWELNKTHRYNVIFFLLSLEYYRMFYNLLFFYFFSVFWILLKFRYIYFMKSKERAGEWIFFLCNFSSIPLVFWLRWLSHLLFVWGCRGKRSASRVLFRGTAAEALDRL